MTCCSALRRLALAATLAALCACQNAPTPSPPALEYQHIAWEHRTPGCEGENCPLVNIDTLRFLDERGLNPIIDRRLREMTVASPDDRVPDTLQAYEQRFLANAAPGYSSYLQAKVREQDEDLIVIELSSYLFTGGAHGMPGRGFINYDRRLGRALELSDMLEPGAEDRFWEKARAAHQRWLKAQGVDQDAEYRRTWPFEKTRNVALGHDAVYLKYDVYALAPYASGHPELVIPYAELRGILKPEYLR